MIALLQAELLKLRTTRTFAAVVGTRRRCCRCSSSASARACPITTRPHALFTNSSVTYFIVLLGAIGMTGEWRHRTITGTVLAAPNRVRLLAAKVLSYSAAGVVLSLLVTVATMVVGTLVLSSRGDDDARRRRPRSTCCGATSPSPRCSGRSASASAR